MYIDHLRPLIGHLLMAVTQQWMSSTEERGENRNIFQDVARGQRLQPLFLTHPTLTKFQVTCHSCCFVPDYSSLNAWEEHVFSVICKKKKPERMTQQTIYSLNDTLASLLTVKLNLPKVQQFALDSNHPKISAASKKATQLHIKKSASPTV